MSVDLREVRSFVVVAERLHFRLAARELGISEAAVSRHVSQLEQKLGVRLLERTQRSVRLSEAGRVYLETAQAVLAEMERGARRAREAAGQRKRLRIGFPQDVS